LVWEDATAEVRVVFRRGSESEGLVSQGNSADTFSWKGKKKTQM